MQYWFFGLPGSGKSHVASLFSCMLNVSQIEGDDFHTENDRKMIAEGSFTLVHRHAQLKRILNEIQDSDVIVTHPLPDKISRSLIRESSCQLIYVTAPLFLIKRRLAAREGHHFGAELLDAWIPRHWEEPVGEGNIVINNDGNESLEHQLEKLIDL